jgi:hypothetical protein
VVCPRCSADNAGDADFCVECGLELHPDRGHERAAGIRRDDDTVIIEGVQQKKIAISSSMVAIGAGVLLVAWIPVFSILRQRAQVNTCQSHLKNLALAVRMYAQDSDSYMPSADNWTEAVGPYLKGSSNLSCPSRATPYAYAYNIGLSVASISTVQQDGKVVAFFEAASDKPDLSGTDNLWLTPSAHSGGNNVVLLNGTVKLLRDKPDPAFWNYSPLVTPPSDTAPPVTEPNETSPSPTATPHTATQNGAAPNDAAPGSSTLRSPAGGVLPPVAPVPPSPGEPSTSTPSTGAPSSDMAPASSTNMPLPPVPPVAPTS